MTTADVSVRQTKEKITERNNWTGNSELKKVN